MNIQIAYEPSFEQIVCRMPVEPGACERLAHALETGALIRSEFFGFTGEPIGLFSDAFIEVDGRYVYLAATDDQNEIRLSVDARNLNGLDHTEFDPDVEGSWIEFVQPLRKVLEILQ